MKYWSNNGTHEAEAAALQELVPGYGNCATHKGEVWRAATKIYHDYFNNGFGNEWQSAAEFLMDNISLPKAVEAVLLEHAAGNIAEDEYAAEMDLMIDTVILQLRDAEDRPNTVDMWDYSSAQYRRFAEEYSYEEEEDDYYY